MYSHTVLNIRTNFLISEILRCKIVKQNKNINSCFVFLFFFSFPDEPMLVPSRCIFFHETTCSSPILTAQQACAVESAATTNRNLNIFLLLFASGKFSGKSKSLAKILETYSNVYIRRARLSTYVIDTPIEDWFSANIWSLSDNRVWLYRDLHDYIRMLTLWKFGGVALNLNGVVQA